MKAKDPQGTHSLTGEEGSKEAKERREIVKEGMKK